MLLIDDKQCLQKYCDRWALNGLILPLETYTKLFGSLHSSIKDTKLKDFQYRLLLGKLVTNKDLFEWGKRENPLCTFCENSIETTTHLLVECTYSNKIWSELVQLCNNEEITTDFSVENIIVNLLHENANHIVNYIVLIIKQYLYRKRCQGRKPCCTEVLREIDQHYMVEMCNAKKIGQTTKFCKRWYPICKM